MRINFIQKVIDLIRHKKKKLRNVPDYGIMEKYGKPYVPYIEVHLCDHCNLNCKGCGHFSPLVKGEVFADVNQFERDLQELSKKISLGRMRLMGGEPLLHKDVNKFMAIARKYFPKTELRLVTNGILLPTMPEEFWQTAKDNDIRIDISVYPPVKDKFETYLSLLKKHKVKFGASHDCEYFYNSTNSNGDSNIAEAFKNCESNVCHNLWNSKLYTCPICFKKYFYEYFNQVPENIEGLDIYSLSGEEIRDGLSKPIAQCRYCSPTNAKKFKWEQSKKEITEWV